MKVCFICVYCLKEKGLVFEKNKCSMTGLPITITEIYKERNCFMFQKKYIPSKEAEESSDLLIQGI